MFTPTVAKPQGDPDKSTASKLEPQRVLNPADKSPAQDTDGMHEQAAAPPVLSWDFSKIPVFPPGEPLDGATQARFEGQFGRDLSTVRIHQGPAVRAAAHVFRAQAFSIGSHIAWPDSAPAIGSSSGRRLLAHELAHVVQQEDRLPGGAPAGGTIAEQEARAASAAVESGGPIAVSPTRLGLACSPDKWLSGSPDLSSLSYADLTAEIEELKRWMASQSKSTPDVLRIEQVLEELLAEVDRRDNSAKSHPAKAAPGTSAPRPRMLAKKGSVLFRDENDMRREVSHMEAWLESGDLNKSDRAAVELELNAVQPLAGVIDHFSFDGSQVPGGQEKKLKAIARMIVAAPRAPVRLVGHTDPVGNHEYNVDLGKRRGAEVKRLLNAALQEIHPGGADIQYDIFSPGETVPVDTNKTEQGRERNRRVEIFVPAAGPWLADPAAPVKPTPEKKTKKTNDTQKDDDTPIFPTWTVIAPQAPIPWDFTHGKDIAPPRKDDDSGHPILHALKGIAGLLGITLSAGIVTIGEDALSRAIGAILAAFELEGVGTAGIGLAGEMAAEAILEELLGNSNAVFNVNEIKTNFPLIDLITPNEVSSVKTFGILTDRPYEEIRAKMLKAWRQGVGLQFDYESNLLETAADDLMKNRDAILKQGKQAVPEAIRKARSVKEMESAVKDLFTLRVPEDYVEPLRRDAAQFLFEQMGIEADVVRKKHLSGRAVTLADARRVQKLTGQIQGIHGITSSDFKALLEEGKRQFLKKPKL